MVDSSERSRRARELSVLAAPCPAMHARRARALDAGQTPSCPETPRSRGCAARASEVRYPCSDRIRARLAPRPAAAPVALPTPPRNTHTGTSTYTTAVPSAHTQHAPWMNRGAPNRMHPNHIDTQQIPHAPRLPAPPVSAPVHAHTCLDEKDQATIQPFARRVGSTLRPHCFRYKDRAARCGGACAPRTRRAQYVSKTPRIASSVTCQSCSASDSRFGWSAHR